MPFWVEWTTLCSVRALCHMYYTVILVLDPAEVYNAFAPVGDAPHSLVRVLQAADPHHWVACVFSVALAVLCVACASLYSTTHRRRAVKAMLAYQAATFSLLLAGHASAHVHNWFALALDGVCLALFAVHHSLERNSRVPRYRPRSPGQKRR